MNAELNELYFQWLYKQIGSLNLKNPRITHWFLARQLHKKEFIWFVPNDDNRVEDGLELRAEFQTALGITELTAVDDEGCSMLEMLIALARRASFQDEEELSPKDWFWMLLSNLELDLHTSDFYYSPDKEIDVDVVLENVIQRRYSRDGHGGLFPLEHAHRDQRKVELWYQMSEYLMELV